ncbi:MAG: hypothetical protein HY866_16605 [Chloroflexi bacterium]|nr:hypothetical protein [Chloroflexota bacterium]
MDSEQLPPEPDQEKPKRTLDGEVIEGMPDISVYGMSIEMGERKAKNSRASRRRSRSCPFILVMSCLGCCCLCCILPFCCTGSMIGAGAALFDNNKVTKTFIDAVDVPEGEVITLDIDNQIGDVTIKPGVSDQVIVDVVETAYGLNKEYAQDHLDKIQVEVTQPDETTVNIVVKNLEDKSPIYGVGDIDLVISVPPRVFIIAKGNIGAIKITDLEVYGLDVETTIGDIDFDGRLAVEGEPLYELSSTTGAIRVSLPADIKLQIDAESTTSKISVSDQFDKVSKESSTTGDNASSATWLGVLGGGNAKSPLLRLRTTLGDITVEPR